MWNRGILSQHNACQKSCHGLRLLAPNRYESDLSNDILYALVGQEAAKNIRGQSWRLIRYCRLSQIRDWCARGPADLADFFRPPTLTSVFFCSLLTYMRVQYLIWKIWFIYVWRLKARAMAWLLMWFMFTQSTFISYYTEAFVKNRSWLHCTHFGYTMVIFGKFSFKITVL